MMNADERTSPPYVGVSQDTVAAEFARIVDELTRRGFLTGTLAGTVGLGLVGCSATASAPPKTGRQLTAAYGEIKVPANPTRVVALGKAALATLLDVGLTPVGTDADEEPVAIPAYQKKVAAVPTVSSYGQFDVEKIAALKPDLIVSYDTYLDKNLSAQLSEFAAVYALKTDEGNIPWQRGTAAFANAVNRGVRLGTVKTQYEQKLASVKSRYAHVLHKNRWEIVQAADPGTFYRYLPSSDPAKILTALGATLGNKNATGPNYWGPELSYETLGSQLGKADVILTVKVGDQPLLAAPTFATLPAAATGRVYATDLLFPASYSGALDLLRLVDTVCGKLADA